jgi:hypothetical protein
MGKTAIQAPGDEQRLPFRLPMGKTSLMEAHTGIVGLGREKSQGGTNPGLANRRFAPR